VFCANWCLLFVVGESEAKVRSLFAEAVKVAPCIIFIDEIDAITPKRETAQREMERRIVAQLLICMDDLRQASGDFSNRESSEVYNRVKHRGHVVVIGATNRPDSLDPALRRPGRFDREIALGIPDEDARERILAVLASNMRLEGTVDFKAIARRTPGFVGADLAAVTTEAATIAVKRILSTKETRYADSI
jgi:ribosome biogenesis ATPase